LPIPAEDELRITVGDSRRVFLAPFVEPNCAETIVSVTWFTENPSVAYVTAEEPAYRGGWATGVSPGPGSVGARIRFADGSVQQTTPRAIIVVPLSPPAGIVVAEGVLRFDSPGGSRYIPFELPRDAGQVDIFVDWISVLNTVNFVMYKGSCSGTSLCGGLEFVPLPTATGVKPIRKSTGRLSAGPYTIRIDSGPRAETIRYEVRLRLE
jgi:hypothetical protein